MNLKGIRTKTAGDVVSALESEYFRLDRVRGSHHVYLRGQTIIVVPYSKESDTLSPGVLKAICKQAGWDSRCHLVRCGLLHPRNRKERDRAEAMRGLLAREFAGVAETQGSE